MSLEIVAHQRAKLNQRARMSRKRALVERDIHAVRTRVYALKALRRYFVEQQRAALADRLERLMRAAGLRVRPHD